MTTSKRTRRICTGERGCGHDWDLAPLLREIAGSRADFIADPESDQAQVSADRDRLTSLFGNLVGNAREAAGEDGRVRVGLFQHPNRLVVEVSGNGEGMDSEFVQNDLFKPFRSTKKKGFGIGVVQCRDYARDLGGDLEVVTSPGSGTTVRVTLPMVTDQTTFERLAGNEVS